MDVHVKENLSENSCFTTRIRVQPWTLVNFSGFPQVCTCRCKETNFGRSEKFTSVCTNTIPSEHFNYSGLEIEYGGSNACYIHRRRSYLPGGSFPT